MSKIHYESIRHPHIKGTMSRKEWEKMHENPLYQGKLRILKTEGPEPVNVSQKPKAEGVSEAIAQAPPEAKVDVERLKGMKHEQLDKIIDENDLDVKKSLNLDEKVEAIKGKI